MISTRNLYEANAVAGTGTLTKSWKLQDDLLAYYYIDGRPKPVMEYSAWSKTAVARSNMRTQASFSQEQRTLCHYPVYGRKRQFAGR